MGASTDWWSIGLGLGCVLVGLGIMVVCFRLAGLLSRVGRTLDEVDRQIAAVGAPVATTLSHVGGIADTADATIARLGVAVASLESVASGATRTANQIGNVVTSLRAGFGRRSDG